MSNRFDDVVDPRAVVGAGVRRQANELVLPEGEYAYIQDTTKGVTQVRTGPAVVNLQGQDRPVVFNGNTRRFDEVALTAAAQVAVMVPKGCYCVLQNPASGTQAHPHPANTQPAAELLLGRKEHIAGPASFALWPRQLAQVITGHQLRLNQYLTLRVYDEEAARVNWSKAVIKRVDGVENTTSTDDTPSDLSVGRMLIIRGTDVSFYIPPTGIEVVPDERGEYVREALTLERLQYCILIDENGRKQYVRGPDVVFPLPTQRFHADAGGERKFRPIELTGKMQGIHVKVIADYVDTEGDHGRANAKYSEGDELFITGDTTPIYFPCEQHSAIRYDGMTKHFGTAIPAGDGRYVLDRQTGEIKMLTGGESGTMSLPDPRKDVFVRRVLTDVECELLYPGNTAVHDYNASLRDLQAKAPSTRKGVVTEGEMLRAASKSATKSAQWAIASSMSLDATHFADASPSYSVVNAEMGGDEFARKATYTEPRVVTLGNTKFAGVPKIDIWTGYAIMVKDTAGTRRVELGPKRVLLGFNETLEALTLSTGTPKRDNNLMKTAYLQTVHNRVSNVITLETSDHVRVNVHVAMRVNFEGDNHERWFSVANYVKLLCDHVGSVLKAAARKLSIGELFSNSENFIRDTVLGIKPDDGSQRQGMFFSENSMRIYDVDVLNVGIDNPSIHALLTTSQLKAVESNIKLQAEERELAASRQQELYKRQLAEAVSETYAHEANLRLERLALELKVGLESIESEQKKVAQTLLKQRTEDEMTNERTLAQRSRLEADANAKLAIDRAELVLREEWLERETAASVARLGAVQSGFSEALLALGNQDTLVKVAEAMSIQNMLGGKDLPDVIKKVFEGTPLAGLMSGVVNAALPQKK